MPTVNAPNGGGRIRGQAALAGFRPRNTLRHRLPALILALLAFVGGAFAWMAYRQVEDTLLTRGTDRISAAGGELAALLAQTAAARMTEAARLAADPGVRQFLQAESAPGEPPPSEIRAFLARTPRATLRAYGQQGQVLGPVVAGARAPAAEGPQLPEGVDPLVGPLLVREGRLFHTVTAPVKAGGPADRVVGHLSVEWAFASAPAAALIGRLVGFGARIKLGNAAGDTWTDLTRPVEAPPPGPSGRPVRFVSETGEARLGTSTAIGGTPWVVWADVSEAALLEPAHALLSRMLPITLFIAILGGLAVYGVSSRITRPLVDAADAAEAVAAGDYSRRVRADRGDEIGRLGAAFNLMAARVAESRDALEEQVQARTEELEHAREELDQFFALSLDLLCIAGADGRFRRVNPAWEQVLGWTAEDLTTAPYLDLVHPDDRADTEAEARKLACGTATQSFENRFRCKDGSYRWLSWKAAPLPGRDVVYAAAHDVTELKRASRDLEQQAADLANANRELEAFSYSVSHDLRAPLRSIDGFAQALVEDYRDRLDDTGRDFLARTRAAAQRMGTLIDDLLALSRVNRVELQVTSVDLSAMAAELAARLHEQEPRRRVEWQIEADLVGFGDPRLLRVALENLLSNAWKFTGKRRDARIELARTTSPEGHPAYVVRDNGAGFDMAHAGKLFGAFQRLHGMAEFPGTGVGLATVQRIVRRHGGAVWSTAAVDQGASFFFTLGHHQSS